MSETLGKERTPEKFWRFVRNINAVGAVALAAAGVVLPQFQTLLFTGATINTAQAVGAEVIRQNRVKKSAAKAT